MPAYFDPDCRLCPRLVAHRAQIHAAYPTYHARPVAPFGDNNPRLLIVGLAPGLHGANRTGRPFTGDFAGVLLFETLYRYGFSNQPMGSERDDGLQLIDCKITNAVKCLPPVNKPFLDEITQCNIYLRNEINALHNVKALLALGRIAHQAVLSALNLKPKIYPFAHGAYHHLPNGLILYDSYHCSRYNTQTKRLTPEMFQAVFANIRAVLPL